MVHFYVVGQGYRTNSRKQVKNTYKLGKIQEKPIYLPINIYLDWWDAINDYSKNKIIDRINSYFGYKVVEKLKLISFDSEISNLKKEELSKKYSTNKKYTNKIINIKNDKVKKSLIELSKFFKKK